LHDVAPWCDVPYTPRNTLQLAFWLFCSITARCQSAHSIQM